MGEEFANRCSVVQSPKGLSASASPRDEPSFLWEIHWDRDPLPPIVVLLRLQGPLSRMEALQLRHSDYMRFSDVISPLEITSSRKHIRFEDAGNY